METLHKIWKHLRMCMCVSVYAMIEAYTSIKWVIEMVKHILSLPLHWITYIYLNNWIESVLAWRIPGTGEPGGLPSMGSHRVGHDWSDLASAAAAAAAAPLSNCLHHDLCLLRKGTGLFNLQWPLRASYGAPWGKWKWSRSVVSDSLRPHGL